MKVYLAARYSRRLELLGYARDLERAGHSVTSRWLQGGHQVSDRGLSDEAPPELRERFAAEDWADLREADACIAFTEEPRTSNSRGGRHVEYGAALAWGKTCVVIGPRENVFCCLREVEVYPTWAAYRTQHLPAASSVTTYPYADMEALASRISDAIAEAEAKGLNPSYSMDGAYHWPADRTLSPGVVIDDWSTSNHSDYPSGNLLITSWEEWTHLCEHGYIVRDGVRMFPDRQDWWTPMMEMAYQATKSQ